MRTWVGCFLLMVAGMLVYGCSSTSQTKKSGPDVPLSKEELFQKGHRLYGLREFDSSLVYLKYAAALDPTYLQPIEDLAALSYDLAQVRAEQQSERFRLLKESQSYYAKLDEHGDATSEVLERLCDIAVQLEDQKTFLKYAKKNAEHYPFERQYHNLSLAFIGAEEYQEGIKFLKTAIEKFPSSTFTGSYYRHLGWAYYKIDRHQTAERTFYAGIESVDAKLLEMKNAEMDLPSTDVDRLREDKIAMLVTLKGLHQLYKDHEKLAAVDRELKELGYSK